ncbi:unnamed protein product [Calypogeia fissa]
MATGDATKITFSDSDKLVGASNYMIWSFMVEQTLREKDLWDIVDPPSATSAATTSETSTTTSTASSIAAAILAAASVPLPASTQDKDRVIIIITKTVSATVVPVIMRFRDDPQKLWSTLKRNYESAALQRRLDLKTNLLNLKMTEGSSVQEYLHTITHHVVELARVGDQVADQDLIQIVLRNLPESWSNFTAVYGVLFAQSSTTANFSDLQEFLQAEESRRKARTDMSEQSLMVQSAKSTPPYSPFPSFSSSGRSCGRGRWGG